MTLRKTEADRIERLTFGDDWIDVRAERRYGDTIKAQRAAAANLRSRSGRNAAAAPQIDFDLAAFNLALLTSMIVAWSDDAPITEETVQELPDSIAQDVLSFILRAEIEEDQKAPLEISSTSVLESPDASGQSETAEAPVGPAI
jgi:hypothetical protein